MQIAHARPVLAALALAALAVSTGLVHATEKAAATPAMSATPAMAAVVGKPAPNFTLTDTDGKTHNLADYTKAGKTVVLEWYNPDCPVVKRYHDSSKKMSETYAKFADKNVVWLAVNSGGPGKQGHGLDRNKESRGQYKMNYPVLLDESGQVGMMYGAKTTPHMFVIAPNGSLAYVGSLDDGSNPQQPATVNYVAEALQALVAGKAVTVSETKSFGCSVKYAG